MQKYRIIGADGREYGPVTAEQVRQWIAQGRVNAQTRVRFEGATEWKLASEVPEFAERLGMPAPATAPPRARLSDAEGEALAREILARGYQLQIGHCVGRGWNLVMSNFALTAGASALVFLLSAAVGAVPFGTLLLKCVLAGGLQWMFLKLIRGQKAEFGDAFAGFSLAFAPLLVLSLVSQLLTLVGFLCCILPGIYLLVGWMFASLLVMDKGLDFWPAMEVSRKVVTHHWWQLFGLCLLLFVLTLAGTIVFCLGFFIALPLITAASVYAYEDIFGGTTAPSGLGPALPPAPVAPATPPASATPSAPTTSATPPSPITPAAPSAPAPPASPESPLNPSA